MNNWLSIKGGEKGDATVEESKWGRNRRGEHESKKGGWHSAKLTDMKTPRDKAEKAPVHGPMGIGVGTSAF